MNLCFVNILIKSYTYVWYPGKGWRIEFVDLELSVGGFNDSNFIPNCCCTINKNSNSGSMPSLNFMC